MPLCHGYVIAAQIEISDIDNDKRFVVVIVVVAILSGAFRPPSSISFR